MHPTNIVAQKVKNNKTSPVQFLVDRYLTKCLFILIPINYKETLPNGNRLLEEETGFTNKETLHCLETYKTSK